MISLPIRLCLALSLGLATAACGGPTASSSGATPPAELEASAPTARFDADELRSERDRFPSLIDPAHVAPKVSWLRAEDEVIGVVVGGEARAYATWMIGYHHLVNDRLGNTPILVAY